MTDPIVVVGGGDVPDDAAGSAFAAGVAAATAERAALDAEEATLEAEAAGSLADVALDVAGEAAERSAGAAETAVTALYDAEEAHARITALEGRLAEIEEERRAALENPLSPPRKEAAPAPDTPTEQQEQPKPEKKKYGSDRWFGGR